MLAAAAIVWITLDVDLASPRADVGRGWTIAAEANASFRPVFVYPDFQSGLMLLGGFRLAHALHDDVSFAVVGRTGATFVDDWRPLFEAAAELRWNERFEVRAGARPDDRLRREGALAGFRDPTGRLFVDVTALPLRFGPLGVGAGFHYERAMPGTGRLPSAMNVTAVARVRFAR
jgi:hypothetical protein